MKDRNLKSFKVSYFQNIIELILGNVILRKSNSIDNEFLKEAFIMKNAPEDVATMQEGANKLWQKLM